MTEKEICVLVGIEKASTSEIKTKSRKKVVKNKDE